jgi:hypothetical protein
MFQRISGCVNPGTASDCLCRRILCERWIMRGRIGGVMVLVAVSILALPVLSQTIGPETDKSSASATHTPVKKASANRAEPTSHLFRPYTAKFKVVYLEAKADGTPVTEEEERVEARDTYGRTLDVTTGLSHGDAHYRVIDPVAGTLTVWDISNLKAKVLKFPEPVSGRKSCWKIAAEDLAADPFGMQFGLFTATCLPAEAEQPQYCKDSKAEPSSVAKTSSEKVPVLEASFSDCIRDTSVVIRGATGVQDEDLGTETILGYPTHGCRVTTKLSHLSIVLESWITKFGLQDGASETMVLRSLSEQSRSQPGMPVLGHKSEIVSLNSQEPEVALFQPPKSYEIRKTEMLEVPCEELKPLPPAQ